MRTTLILPLMLAVVACKSSTHEAGDHADACESRELQPGMPVQCEVQEGESGTFTIHHGETPGRIVFTIEHRAFEDCAAFTVRAPSGVVLYADTHETCGRRSALPPQKVETAAMKIEAGPKYRLEVPSSEAGVYQIAVRELGRADNELPYRWRFVLTAGF